MAPTPPPVNGNGRLRAGLHRDTVIMRMVIAVTLALTALAVISQLRPSDWTIMTIVVQVLAQALTGLLTGYFTLQQRGQADPPKGP